ncbi:MAG TPA: hypothetical protein VGG13_03180 [Candidatus Saccharimonadales bacterium]
MTGPPKAAENLSTPQKMNLQASMLRLQHGSSTTASILLSRLMKCAV